MLPPAGHLKALFNVLSLWLDYSDLEGGCICYVCVISTIKCVPSRRRLGCGECFKCVTFPEYEEQDEIFAFGILLPLSIYHFCSFLFWLSLKFIRHGLHYNNQLVCLHFLILKSLQLFQFLTSLFVHWEAAVPVFWSESRRTKPSLSFPSPLLCLPFPSFILINYAEYLTLIQE